jgi:hypothetical protein
MAAADNCLENDTFSTVNEKMAAAGQRPNWQLLTVSQSMAAAGYLSKER